MRRKTQNRARRRPWGSFRPEDGREMRRSGSRMWLGCVEVDGCKSGRRRRICDPWRAEQRHPKATLCEGIARAHRESWPVRPIQDEHPHLADSDGVRVRLRSW